MGVRHRPPTRTGVTRSTDSAVQTSSGGAVPADIELGLGNLERFERITGGDGADRRDELAARAARSGRSLQEYLRAELIDLADHPDPGVLARRIRDRKDRTGTVLPVAEILEYRDDDRR